MKKESRAAQSTTNLEPVAYVIDDDPGVRNALGRLFRSVGLRSELFQTASDLMDRNLPRVPSCLVLDIRLPGLSGFELAKRMASTRGAMRVLYVSGYADRETATQALGEPNVAYLQKPFTLAELASKVAAILSPKRTSGE